MQMIGKGKENRAKKIVLTARLQSVQVLRPSRRSLMRFCHLPPTPLSLRGTAQHLPVHGQLHVQGQVCGCVQCRHDGGIARASARTITSAVCVSEGVCCARLVWLRSCAITFAVARAVTLQLSTRKSARGRPRALLVAGRVSYSSLDLESDDVHLRGCTPEISENKSRYPKLSEISGNM